MNFVLHRHLAARDTGDDVAGLGAMLPDLWRMADRRMRARGDVALDASAPPPFRSLQAGVAHHLEADRWFHRLDAFEQPVGVLFRALEGLAPKASLFAHPLLELALDGALLRRVGHDTTLLALRRTHGDLQTRSLEAVTAAHRRSASAPAAAAIATAVSGLLDGMTQSDWIAGYLTGYGLAARLDRLRQRVGLPALDETGKHVLAQIASGLDHDADRLLETVLRRAPS